MCTKMQKVEKKRDRDMWRKGHSEIMRKGCKDGCNTKQGKIGHPKMLGLRISSRVNAVAFLTPIYRWLIRKTISKLFVHILGNWSPAPDRLYSWAIYLPLFYSVSCISLSLHLSLSPLSVCVSPSLPYSHRLSLFLFRMGSFLFFSIYLLLFPLQGNFKIRGDHCFTAV